MKHKIKKRFNLLLKFSTGVVLAPLFGMLIAYAVIREGSVALWGAFVVVQALLHIALQCLSWGNKDYLLRQFSLKPAQTGPLWRTYLLTRVALVLPPVLLAAIWSGFQSEQLPWIALWLGGWALHQSFEVLAHFRKRFLTWTLIEASGSVLILGMLAFGSQALDLPGLIRLYALAAVLRCALAVICFRRTPLGREGWRVDWKPLATALPFLLLTLTHVFLVKTDIFCIHAILGGEQTGLYQIFLSLLVYIKTGAYYLTAPFQKNLYRLNKESRARYRRLLVQGAALLIPTGLALAYLIMTYVYRLSPPASLYFLGAIFALPFYLFLPRIHQAIRAGHYGRVFAFDLLGVAVNLGLNLLWIPRFQLPGALAANACGQWCIWLAYMLYQRKTKH